ncbi:hypothetical protein FOA52_009860 [Chlamydomonas sp. UWO 241]|nr:hypothetical protein FOA52_009860 [Chlamydomonas sp. UWO 241]
MQRTRGTPSRMGTTPSAPSGANALQLFDAEVGRAIDERAAQLAILQTATDSAVEAAALVADLPRRLTHGMLVPFGSKAFFRGELRHTNELTVHLGGEYYATVTAQHAGELLERQRATMEQQTARLQAQVDDLVARRSLLSGELGLPPGGTGGGGGGGAGERGGGGVLEPREIRESVEESDALLATARRPAAESAGATAGPSDYDLDDMFARMEALETADEAGGGGGRAGSGARVGGAHSDAALFAPVQLGGIDEGDEGDEDEQEEGDGRGGGKTAGGGAGSAAQAANGRSGSGAGAASGGRSGGGSGFKRGFLSGGVSKGKAGGSSSGGGGGSGSGGVAAPSGSVGGASAQRGPAASVSPHEAFTGEVVERESAEARAPAPAPAAPARAVVVAAAPRPVVVERVVHAPEDAHAADAMPLGGAKRVSMFKQARQQQQQ